MILLKPETDLKIEILTRGVEFSKVALKMSIELGAKGQNLVYNAPKDYCEGRPQELFLTYENFTTVVSCVSPHKTVSPIIIDVKDGKLISILDNIVIHKEVEIGFVPEPGYYNLKTSLGENVKKYISACGYDELNIIPWKGCLLSKACKFCGANKVAVKNPLDALHASHISKDPEVWHQVKENYLQNLTESIQLALEDPCYDEHMHVILISGNLSNSKLDAQCEIYCEISRHIEPLLREKATEGLIVVITPPTNMNLLNQLKESGVNIVVFNLEVGNEPWFSKYCPGKSTLGRDFFIERLKYSVDIFGYGKVWTNFVLGLEPVKDLLNVCRELAHYGIVSSANVLHLDEGNRLDCNPPTKEQVVEFFYGLNKINQEFKFSAFYCQKALRTSLSNEFQANRYSIL